MQTLMVELDERSYPIHVGPGLIDRGDLYAPYIAGRQVMIVTNETVAALYLQRVKAQLGDYQLAETILPDGEQYKTIDCVEQIWDGLLAARFNRRATIIALGGGVIGDMAGFAAACYQRGIAFIQVPTTLLSQVDSSVGGKTGVNHPRGKNMIGAFWQPRAVIIDTATLESLPPRELSAGLAEVIKYGLIRDLEFLAWLEDNVEALRALDAQALTKAILRSCAVKAEIVAEDETEQGVRALLNLGHTFGHAIETDQGYGRWLHGEAVASGMMMAATLSARLNDLDAAALARVETLLRAAGLPVHAPEGMSSERFLELMRLDKKVLDAGLRLVLLDRLGQARVEANVDEALLVEMLNAYPRATLARQRDDSIG
ncbi:3-dehydroquinate synthase [Halotalea alkalilenta]|uniref:3-dehydroquinate synthase n=1 Tax=Halotalea alkalilenta TaxID=376489 RepID=A0A172YCP5_9GAMM|nr:3-dehydroquinate synthase [Halotalea alkalilenta]ANF56993.1 3-dehydroquinate synthase [Halotalea alkalilenta]